MRRLATLAASILVLVPGLALAAPEDPGLELHILNRLAWGPAPGDLDAIRRLGVETWVDRQLHPDAIAEPAELEARLAALSTLGMDPAELFREYGPPARVAGEPKPDPEAVKAARQRARVVIAEATEARLLREIDDPRRLETVMTAFWYNHFNVFAEKGLDHLWAGNFEEEAIRPHVFGRFRDLLEATARHPAMLFYLDNWRNVAPGTARKAGADERLNENYARELMELHTLGVDGGYTQADVVALAHILTGWGLGGPKRGGRGGFLFDPARHDASDQHFLGHTIRGGGEEEVEQALDILADSPATAHHLSFQLAQYFVADDPPKSLVDRLAARWRETRGDLRRVVKTLIDSPEFRDPANRGAKFKTPEEFVVSAVRAAGVPMVNPKPLEGELRRLGEPLFQCLTPDGYAATSAAWLNADALAQRISFAIALGAGRLKLDTVPAPDETGMASVVRTAAEPEGMRPDPASLVALLGPSLSARTKAAVEVSPEALRAGMVLGSPDFMKR